MEYDPLENPEVLVGTKGELIKRNSLEKLTNLIYQNDQVLQIKSQDVTLSVANSGIRGKIFHESDVFYKLESNFDSWRFSPYPPLVTNQSRNWTLKEIILQLASWGEGKLHEHFHYLSLWLIRQHFHLPPDKANYIQQCLLDQRVIKLKPFAELANAELNLCFELFLRCPLAQRAESENHLWLALQYSELLCMKAPPVPSKTQSRNNTTDVIRLFRKALFDSQTFEEVKESIEPLKKRSDWQRYIKSFLLVDAIEWHWADDNSNLDEIVRSYLREWSRFNGCTGHKKDYGLLPLQKIKPRSRGRPPKGFKTK